MSSCKHEWRMGHVSFGCTPGVRFADYRCVRCHARDRRRVSSDDMRQGYVEILGLLVLELDYRCDEPGGHGARRHPR